MGDDALGDVAWGPVAAPGGRSVLAVRVASSERQREAWAAVIDGTA